MRISIVLVFIFLFINAKCQNFEGSFLYQITYFDKENKIDTSTTSLAGQIQRQYFKDGNWKVLSNGKQFNWAIYDNSENRYYLKMSYTDTIYWTDGGLNSDSILKVERKENSIKLLGYDCSEVTFFCKNKITKYYYVPSKFTMSPNLFTKYKSGTWTEFLKISNSLPLLQIEIDESGTLEIRTIGISESILDKSIFEIDRKLMFTKNPY